MFASSTSPTARPSLLHRALRTAVAFATLEAVVLEPGESAAERGAGSSGAASSRNQPPHPHRTELEGARRPGRKGAVAPASQPCLLACRAAAPARRAARTCRAGSNG